MKRTVKQWILMAALPVALLTGCVTEDFDVPDVIIPSVDFDSNLSIADLKSGYSGGLDSIGGDTIIQGIIIANDESGNFYKTLVIQDNTAGIELKIDRTDMYNEFRVGQRVYVKCQGLYLGNYGSLTQLGYIYGGEIGRIPDVMVADHLFKDSLPGAAPVPTIVTIPTLSANNLSTLIKLDSVHFVETGSPFSETTGTTNRTIEDKDGNTLLLRTSNYANFAADLLPTGKGCLVGVLSIYNGDYQFYIRDLNDLVEWDINAPGPVNLLNELFTVSPTGWLLHSAASSINWAWSSSYSCMAINGFGADVANDDWLITPAIDLNGVTSPILTFRTWTKYADSGMPNPMSVKISTNYTGTGDPTLATWVDLTAIWSPSNSQAWTGSGDIDLSAYLGNTVYIAFRYQSSGTASGATSQWEVDEVKVSGIQ